MQLRTEHFELFSWFLTNEVVMLKRVKKMKSRVTDTWPFTRLEKMSFVAKCKAAMAQACVQDGLVQLGVQMDSDGFRWVQWFLVVSAVQTNPSPEECDGAESEKLAQEASFIFVG